MPVKQKDREKLMKAVKAHRAIADMADDPNVLAALDDLTDSAEERERAAADLDQWVKDKQVKLPQGAKVIFDKNNWYIAVELPTGSDSSVTFGYDSDEGWFSEKT